MQLKRYTKCSVWGALLIHFSLLALFGYSVNATDIQVLTVQRDNTALTIPAEKLSEAESNDSRVQTKNQPMEQTIQAYLHQMPLKPNREKVEKKSPMIFEDDAPGFMSLSALVLSDQNQSTMQFPESHDTTNILEQLADTETEREPDIPVKRCKWQQQKQTSAKLSAEQLEFYQALTAWKQSLARRIQRQQYYPSDAIKQNIGGEVIVSFQMDRQGKINKPYVLSSSGNADIDAAALYAVSSLPTVSTAKKFIKKGRKKLSLHLLYDANKPAHPQAKWPKQQKTQTNTVQVCE